MSVPVIKKTVNCAGALGSEYVKRIEAV
jgi:hypothetical protein